MSRVKNESKIRVKFDSHPDAFGIGILNRNRTNFINTMTKVYRSDMKA